MNISKADKKDLAKKLGKKFETEDVFLADFHGLKFEQTNELRQTLRDSNSKFTVTRNTVVSHALENAKLKPGDPVTQGPTAVVTIENPEDVSKIAKVLFAFAKKNKALKIKGGFTAKEWMNSSDLEKLSKIGSKPELLTQLAGLLYSNLAQIRFVLEAPTRDLALVINALKESK
ncbi:MAG: 50S ribosomal protein L10 [Elusimicrobiales bacterium]|nr:50S ribosomal protein L10 [Elusimicrobiales bacterium]MCK5584204.1 50S ribosomal protein L10 [Elusimicrobiales bacterium]